MAMLLGASLPEVAQFLLQYDVEVSWLEQDALQSVHRTTFAFDWESAANQYADLFARSSANGGGALGGNGEDGGAGDAEAGAGDDDVEASRLEDGSIPRVIVRSGVATEAQKAALRARVERRNRARARETQGR
jgi:hypothetical protein